MDFTWPMGGPLAVWVWRCLPSGHMISDLRGYSTSNTSMTFTWRHHCFRGYSSIMFNNFMVKLACLVHDVPYSITILPSHYHIYKLYIGTIWYHHILPSHRYHICLPYHHISITVTLTHLEVPYPIYIYIYLYLLILTTILPSHSFYHHTTT